jgi:hypothetical protein
MGDDAVPGVTHTLIVNVFALPTPDAPGISSRLGIGATYPLSVSKIVLAELLHDAANPWRKSLVVSGVVPVRTGLRVTAKPVVG